MAKAVELFYVDGLPRHIAAPENSSISIMTSEAFEAMDASQMQQCLQSKHLVISSNSPAMSFDEALSTVASQHMWFHVTGLVSHPFKVALLSNPGAFQRPHSASY